MEDPIMKQILEDSPEIAEAERRYQEFIADEQLRSRLDARDKFIRTQAQLLHDAEEKGKAEGIAEGIAEGKEEGRNEERREMARKMKNDGLGEAEIVRYTGLSEEDVRAL